MNQLDSLESQNRKSFCHLRRRRWQRWSAQNISEYSPEDQANDWDALAPTPGLWEKLDSQTHCLALSCLSYVYPSVYPYLASFLGVYLCLCWSIYLSVTYSKAILLFDKQNKVTYPYAEL